MKHLSLLLGATLVLASCAGPKVAATDPIDTLVARLNASMGLWVNGIWQGVGLPADATPQEVLSAGVKVWIFNQGSIKTYRIQEVRKLTELPVGENQPPYMAALIESDLGTRICLFRPDMHNGWSVRFYDVPEETQNQQVHRTP